MMGGAVGHAMGRVLGFWARKILPWLLRYPFILSRLTWAIVLVLAVLEMVASVYLFLPAAFVGLLAILAVIAGLFGWRRLRQKGTRPLLYISQFRPKTPGAEEASLNHQIAMTKRLAENELIATRLELRGIPASIAERESERLLRATSTGRGVVRGDVQTMASAGTFEAVLTYRPSPPKDIVRENQRTREKTADHHQMAPDYQVQLEELVGPHFRAEHADGIEGLLLLLLAEGHLEGREYEDAETCLVAAEPMRPHLPSAGRAHLTLARTFLDHRHNLKNALKALDADADDPEHPELRRAAAWISMVGLQSGQVTPLKAVNECRRAVEANPKNETVRVWLADALTGHRKSDEALEELRKLKEMNFLLEHDWQIILREGAIEYNRGNYEAARDYYEDLVAIHPTTRAHLYYADALVNLDEIDLARYHYREALRLQPDLVDAHRGYWWKVPKGQEPKLLFDRLYRFVNKVKPLPKRWRFKLLYRLARWHFKRHPEDSRVHFMLGSHALLLRDLETAEERLLFANELFSGNDTEAMNRLAILALMKDQDGKATEWLERSRAVPTLGRSGLSVHEELKGRAVNVYLPVLDEPKLLSFEQGQRLVQMIEAIYPDMP
jgi:tetratricopeptide (TPR) repeat protein